MIDAETAGNGLETHRFRWYWRMAILVLLSGLVHLPALLKPSIAGRISSASPAMSAGEVGYIAFVVSFFLTGLALLGLLVVTVRVERPANIRQFFNLGSVDWLSVVVLFLGLAVLNLAEAAFLRRVVYEPLRVVLVSWGLWGQPTSLSLPVAPDPAFRGTNLVLLLLIAWVEAPEEVFFRGYVQNRLQHRIGPNWALLAGALIWDAWHVFAPAEFFRRLMYGLLLSLIFRWRQNTTALAVWHPLGNRLLLLFSIVSAPA